MPSEAWLPVKDFVGRYSVSSYGRVRNEITGRILRGSQDGAGYRKVILCRGDGSPNTHRKVHVAVLEAFVGPRPTNHDACHANGVRDDNRLENLRWDTRAGNHADKRVHGTLCEGERHGRRTLTAEAVRDIRSASGTCREIGDRFGIGPMQVSRIKTGKNWRSLT